MLSVSTKNRLGFIGLGITNNVAYALMLSAAYDLLNESSETNVNDKPIYAHNIDNSSLELETPLEKPYCNAQSTSTVLLADIIPGLIIKIIYPLALVSLPANLKAIITVLLSVAALITTGLAKDQFVVFLGVIFASLQQGFGESVYLGSTPFYGDVSLSGWCIGTGTSGLLTSMSYALLKMVLPIRQIMFVMLVVPVAMLVAYFNFIEPVMDSVTGEPIGDTVGNIGANGTSAAKQWHQQDQAVESAPISSNQKQFEEPFNLMAKLKYLSVLAKYFLPILLVYYAEYLINLGLFELIYFPEVSYLDHASQYRWFLVFYQLGVMVSRSTLEFIQLRNIWAMSLLQFANTLLFLAHTAKLIHLPSFYLVIIVTIYEGLLGGLTFVNGFYRVKKEIPQARQEFSISTVTIAENLGIVLAGLSALPAHDAICKLYV